MFNSATRPHPAIDADDLHRHAYNTAFCELGLKWHWDAVTYRDLLRISGEKDRIRVYLETQQPHLLKAYDADFLSEVIQSTKARRYDAMIACGVTGEPYINWAEFQSDEIGV